LTRNVRYWADLGYGLWIFRERSNGAVVGRGGLHPAIVEGEQEVALAYALFPEAWGRGLATEMACAVVGWAFEVRNAPELTCFTLPTNVASRRVMEKAGFRYDRPVVYFDLPHVHFRLCGQQYLQSRRPTSGADGPARQNEV
jgi:ribosomal-protein-alanine N-acetyltransferase